MSSNRNSEDTGALLVRQRLNESRGRFELSAFVAEHAGLEAGSRILDLGAGTGNPLLRHVRELRGARYHALDRSASSLERLEREAAILGLDVATQCADMDALLNPELAPGLRGLSHVFAIYSLYYSTDALALLRALSLRLATDGCMVIVGPAPGNNLEWFDLLRRAGVPLSSRLLDISESFFPEIVEPFARAHFEATLVKDAENPVTLRSGAELMDYWRSNTYYDENHDHAVEAAIAEAFGRSPCFQIVKRIRLLRMQGRRA